MFLYAVGNRQLLASETGTCHYSMIGDQRFDDQIIHRVCWLQAAYTLYTYELGLYTTIFFCLSHVGRRIHLDMILLKFSIASHT